MLYCYRTPTSFYYLLLAVLGYRSHAALTGPETFSTVVLFHRARDFFYRSSFVYFLLPFVVFVVSVAVVLAAPGLHSPGVLWLL